MFFVAYFCTHVYRGRTPFDYRRCSIELFRRNNMLFLFYFYFHIAHLRSPVYFRRWHWFVVVFRFLFLTVSQALLRTTPRRRTLLMEDGQYPLQSVRQYLLCLVRVK